MKVKILKPWICGGKNPPVGKVLDLPRDLAASGIERGLCEPANLKGAAPRARPAPEGKKRRARGK